MPCNQYSIAKVIIIILFAQYFNKMKKRNWFLLGMIAIVLVVNVAVGFSQAAETKVDFTKLEKSCRTGVKWNVFWNSEYGRNMCRVPGSACCDKV